MGGLSVQDRVISEDSTERWCPRCDTWKILSRQHFYVASNTIAGFQRTCKECRKRNDARRPHLELHGCVYLNKLRPWLRQLVTQLGWTKAARRLGVTNAMLARWMKGQKRIQRRHAALILRTCAEVGIKSPLGQGKNTARGSRTWAAQSC